MAGIEIIALGASVLQIADLRWKLSYKLYAFSTKVHKASKAMELISQDISSTGAILKQLGDTVKEDEEAKPASRLSSQGLIDTASRLVEHAEISSRRLILVSVAMEKMAIKWFWASDKN